MIFDVDIVFPHLIKLVETIYKTHVPFSFSLKYNGMKQAVFFTSIGRFISIDKFQTAPKLRFYIIRN